MNQPAMDHYTREFAGLVHDDSTVWLAGIRQSAFDAFRSQGFPTLRQEEWKYTDVRPITKRSFTAPVTEADFDKDFISSAGFPDLECHELVFTNGRFSDTFSNILTLKQGIVLQSLNNAIRTGNEVITSCLNRTISGKNAFVSLNTAFIADGTFIYIPDNVCINEPVNLLFLANKQQHPFASHLRNVIVLGKNARATVIESYNGMEDAEYFTNSMTEIHMGEGAVLEHYKLQRESLRSYHVAYLNVQQARDSRLESHSISLGGALVRNDIDDHLAGEGAQVMLNGLYLANGRQHVDNHTCIHHLKPNTGSKEYYRGVLDGHARGVFNGRVIVHKDAQKTDAHQSNANLLLSDNAEVDTKPELEIYADDVKCSHGATVGQLDDAMLFYLRSRAIDIDTARSLLTFAFADEVIRHIRLEAVRKRLESVVVGKLPDTAVIREFIQ
jgi:Fe-S cluster assembly protein SufD